MTDYSDLTNVAVVRDRDGVMWGVVGPDRWLSLDGSGVRIGTEGLGRHHGPLTPILDIYGQPIIRTVGDLTARHIGKRVRLDEHYDAKLETIFAHNDGEVLLNFTHPEGFTYGCSRDLDTPCEVLP